MKIQDRVRLAFDLGLNKEYLPMLSFVLPAIEEMSRKKYGSGGRSGFLRFIRENYDIIELFVGGFINFTVLRFPTIDLNYTGQIKVERPDLAQVLYHVHRCALAHGQDISENFGVIPRQGDGLIEFRIEDKGKFLNFPEPVAWGLIAAVVLEPLNSPIKSRSGNYLTLLLEQNTYFMNIDLFWGEKSKIMDVAGKYSRPQDQTDKIMQQLAQSQ